MAVERVTPEPGARRVQFDYDAADAAITWATRTLPATCREQVATYDPAVVAARVDWEGHFRQEFDRAEQELGDRFATFSGGDLTVVDAAYRAAEEANRRQRTYNQQHTDPADEPEPPPGPGG